MPDMQLQQDVNGRLMEIQPRLPDLDAEPLPDTVYHYTDTAGILGILESGHLWATDYRFLNDSSEIAYIYGLAAEVAVDEFAGTRAGLSAVFVDYAATAARPVLYDETPYYLCCFSALDNSLSQWRAYGGRQGFSLAYPGDISTSAGYQAGGRQNPGLTLLRVVYDEAFHRSYVRALIEALLDLCESGTMAGFASDQEALASFTPFYWAQLDRASYRFKHPDFEVEEEWRLVAWGSIHHETFRAAHTITPYTKFSLLSEATHAVLPGRLHSLQSGMARAMSRARLWWR